MQNKLVERKLCFSFSLFVLAVGLCAVSTAFAASPYDYYAELSPVSTIVIERAMKQTVFVKVGNLGASGSSSGPNYDIILTVRRPNGELICETGYSTLPPMSRGQFLRPLSFEVFRPAPPAPPGPPPGTLPKVMPRTKSSTPPPKVGDTEVGANPYIVEANLRTQYPNDDVNPANNYRSQQFNFVSGGQLSCRKLLPQ